MEEYSRANGLNSIEAKLDLLVHHLNQGIHNDSLNEQGVFAGYGFWYQDNLVYENLSICQLPLTICLIKGVQTPHFKRKKSCLLLRNRFLPTWMRTRR